CSMWPIIAVFAVLVAQAQPSPTQKWCFERDQGAQLCEETEEACRKLLDLNTEIARSPCKPVEPSENTRLTMPPPPTNPETPNPDMSPEGGIATGMVLSAGEANFG